MGEKILLGKGGKREGRETEWKRRTDRKMSEG